MDGNAKRAHEIAWKARRHRLQMSSRAPAARPTQASAPIEIVRPGVTTLRRPTDGQSSPASGPSAHTLAVTLGQTVARIAECLGLSERELATTLGVAPRTVARWRDGAVFPQRAARARLDELTALCDRLTATFEPDDVVGWLRAENRALGGLRPIEAIRAGRLDRVHDALEVIDSGIFV
jgi:transcriptional regulator with XRE-family HTH domain